MIDSFTREGLSLAAGFVVVHIRSFAGRFCGSRCGASSTDFIKSLLSSTWTFFLKASDIVTCKSSLSLSLFPYPKDADYDPSGHEHSPANWDYKLKGKHLKGHERDNKMVWYAIIKSIGLINNSNVVHNIYR